MARKRKEGEVVVREWKAGRGFALRFWAYGIRRYLTLGFEGEGDPPLNLNRAEEEMENILADVRRGIWTPPPKEKKEKKKGTRKAKTAAAAKAEANPIFGPFAKGLVKAGRGKVSENQTSYREWGLAHLVPYFGDDALAEIDAEAIDGFTAFKIEEGEMLAEAIDRGRPMRRANGQVRRPLAASSINKLIDILQWVLGIAVEYKKIDENAAVGQARRLVEPELRPVHLDTAEQIEGLLVAGAQLDRTPTYHCTEREAILATLVFAGPRADELCRLLWRDVDLANGRIFIGRSKTPAGLREIRLLPILRDVLAAHKAGAFRSGPDDLVFPTGTGGLRTKDNLRERVLAAAFRRGDKILISRGKTPLPLGLTAHKLRHTFASILVACGEDPRTVMEALGHTDPKFTLKIYTHVMNRDPAERRRLKALVEGERVLTVEAPAPEILALGDYELPILRGLFDCGGRARKREIVDAVGAAMEGRHSTVDLERLPSGQPRWKPRVGKAWIHLEQRGWIESGKARGEWRLTHTGRQKVRRQEPQAAPAASDAPEPRLRLVA